MRQPVMTISPSPLVTVYVATRNRVALLARALASIEGQRRDDIEIIVVDDASDDDTPLLLAEWAAQGRLRWFRNDRSRGACASRNHALREARGRYMAGLDDDDEMLPGRITTLLEALRPEDAFVCGSDWIVATGRRPRLRIVPSRIDRAAILSRNVVGNQVLAERSKLLACGGFDEALPAAQDYDLWIRMILAHGPARGVRRPLQRIHVHAGATRISSSPSRRRGYWTVYRKHRAQMDDASRRAHLYNLRRANGHATRLPRDARFLVPRNRIRLLWHVVLDSHGRRTPR
jgi:glycosyltransferase involved in cell wall biosynthesis